MMATSRL
jgi:hypothetical protein